MYRPTGYQKKRNFALISEMCGSLKFGKREKIVSTLIRDGAVFLEVTSSNKIETVQYLKKTLFYKLVFGFQGHTKIT